MEFFPKGYPRQAAYADSDDSFMIYRRFGYIHSRLLLNKQDELRELEASLHDMDLIDASCKTGSLCLQSRELDEEREQDQGLGSRKVLLEKIEQKTLQYGMLKKFSTRNYTSLILPKTWRLKLCFPRSIALECPAGGGHE